MSHSIAHHTRIKPKVKKAKSKISKEDLAYLSWLNDNRCLFSCFVCGAGRVEFHHVKEHSTDKKNHKRLIPICKMHHTMSSEFSAHGTAKKFRVRYPIEFQYILADKICSDYLSTL